MTFLNFKQIERILSLHKLIKQQHTGNVIDLAEKLHVTTRCVYLYMDELRDMGASIAYDSMLTTYFYTNDFNINFVFEVEVSDNKKKRE